MAVGLEPGAMRRGLDLRVDVGEQRRVDLETTVANTLLLTDTAPQQRFHRAVDKQSIFEHIVYSRLVGSLAGASQPYKRLNPET